MNNKQRRQEKLNAVTKEKKTITIYNQKKIIYKQIYKVLGSLVLFLIISIFIKSGKDGKTFIYENLYNEVFSFAQINKMYKQHFGNVIPVDTIFKDDTKSVFNENIEYQKKESFQNGVNLKVGNKYAVPVMESGMVIFIGKKDGIENTIIVQQIDGVDVWYGNVVNSNVKLYDYIEKGTLLGEVVKDTLYIAYQKEGKFLNYNDYLQ
ncbi:MAG: peptidoglycan DD-metalloendopeptidase family protein [Bacilli bacterium]